MKDFIHKICSGFSGICKSFSAFIAGLLKRWFSRRESFTLMVIPHAPVKNVKSVKFSRRLVSIFVIANVIMFSVACVFFISYYSLNTKLKDKRAEYETLQALKDNEEKQLNEYKANEKEIKEKIEVLKQLEDKLKTIIESKGGKPQSYSSESTAEKAKTDDSFPRLASRGAGADLLVQPKTKSPLEEFESFEDMYSTVDELIGQIDNRVEELNNAIAKAEQRIKAARAKPMVLPTSGRITSYFGGRKNPFGRGYDFHPAIDIANDRGTPIRASGDGVVTEAGWSSGLGRIVVINHKNGYESLYGHNSKIIVNVGDRVKRGQVIAYMGSTGDSTGNHCHFEVRLHGVPVNPFSVK
jgi:murein DD-endopeptidase MepM/ murein hydrolase activator NlpD